MMIPKLKRARREGPVHMMLPTPNNQLRHMHTLFIDKHKDGMLPQVWIIKAAHLRTNEVDTHQVARLDRQLASKRPVLLATPI